jgi:hypothetical protein
MVKLLPKWVMRRYLVLWKKFKNNNFTFEQAQRELEEDDSRIISLFLSELKRNSYLIVEIDPMDSRKRIYQLRPLQKVFDEITREALMKEA